MKKVGIVTYQDIADGKGRFLQAYALYSAIVKLGYDAEIIDYSPINTETKKSSTWHKIIRALMNPKRLPSYVAKLQHNILIMKYEKQFTGKRKKYETFINGNIKITEKKYVGYQSLLDSQFVYDAYVCGSDQIWNPYFQGLDSAYYLKFAPQDKRIAYAPSLGTIQIDGQRKEILKENIKEMPYISVREKSGANLVTELIGREVKNVLDPTLLMSQEWWDDFAGGDIPDKPYVLTFFFDNSKFPRKVANQIAQEKGYDIISIPDSFADIFFLSHKEISIGPERFVNLFKNASFVCTQSFHGVILSLIYNRSFYVFDRETKAYVSGVFSRINDLLKIVGLEDHILKSGQTIPNDRHEINYIRVNAILEEKRKESMAYLKNSLGKATGGEQSVSID